MSNDIIETIIVDEVNGEQSIITYIPNFFTNIDDIQSRLFDLDFYGGSENDSHWTPPRKQVWYHTNGSKFCSSWKDYNRWAPQPYPEWLLEFQNNIQQKFNDYVDERKLNIHIPRINSLLVNLYEDNKSSIHLHQDKISEFGDNPTVLIASFGEERTIDFVRVTPTDKKFVINKDEWYLNKSIALKSGSLLVMGGACQKYYAHQIQKVEESVGKRVSCVFREHN